MISILAPFLLLIAIGAFIFNTSNEESLLVYPWNLLLFSALNYVLLISIKDFDLNEIDNYFSPRVFSVILISPALLYYFGTQIYSSVKFEYGGGSPYVKTLKVKNENGNSYDIRAKVFYENDNFIHFQNDSLLITLSKDYILKQSSVIEN